MVFHFKKDYKEFYLPPGFRDFCLSLPDVTEATPFEKFSKGRMTILVFYVENHMFCYFNVDDFSVITVKCDPLDMAEMKEQYQACPTKIMTLKH